MRPLLAISDLSVAFATERGHVQALDGVSIDVMAGERFGNCRREWLREKRYGVKHPRFAGRFGPSESAKSSLKEKI